MKVHWILLAALSCLVAGCSDDGGGGSSCITLGREAVAMHARQIDTPERQILIEARIVGVRQDHLGHLGINFNYTVEIGSDGGSTTGSSSGDGRDLVVPSSVVGGANNVQYLVSGSQSAGEALGYVTEGFSDPFGLMRAFPLLPFDSCVGFNESDAVEPSNFAGVGGNLDLGSADSGYTGSTLYFGRAGDAALNAALNALQQSAGNTIITAPVVSLYDGQRVALMGNEFSPNLEQLEQPFADRIEEVTSTPTQISSGIVLDVRPTISADGDTVLLELRPETRGVSVAYGTPLTVGNQQADVVLPILETSRAVTTIAVANGQTVILGGLMRENSETVEDGVPFLGDIPVLGELFRSSGLNKDQHKLLIFITPRIIDPSES